jgi:phosphoribosylcarboxyaminoimidazole (NCAIR) mutase
MNGADAPLSGMVQQSCFWPVFGLVPTILKSLAGFDQNPAGIATMQASSSRTGITMFIRQTGLSVRPFLLFPDG